MPNTSVKVAQTAVVLETSGNLNLTASTEYVVQNKSTFPLHILEATSAPDLSTRAPWENALVIGGNEFVRVTYDGSNSVYAWYGDGDGILAAAVTS